MRVLLSGLRRVLFWSHLAVGVVAGLVILLMAVTGVLLGYERQVIALVDGAPRVEVPARADRLPLDEALASAGITRDEVASVALRAAVHEPLTVRFRDRERAAVQVDPYRGDLVAPPADSTGRKAMAALRRWHRWIGAEGGDLRAQMKAVTGAANLAFLGLVLSGVWLWWPRRLTWTAVRNILWFRRGLAPKARDFNWHTTIGFWSAVPLFVVVASGVFISYRWPGLWLDRVAGNPEERAAAIATIAARSAAEARDARSERVDEARGRGGRDIAPGALAAAPLQAYLESATRPVPAWQSVTITLPQPGDSLVSVAVAEGNTYRPDLRTTVRLDAHDGSLAEASGYGALSTSRKIRAWVRFGHTGEVFGLVGQTIATLASLGGAFLVWTGLALSLRRLAAWWRRRRTPPALSAPPSTRRGRASERVAQPVR